MDSARRGGWTIYALNVLSNPVHIVIETLEDPAQANPEKVAADFKAWGTRRLREAQLVTREPIVGSEHGSTRYLKTEDAIARTCHYVLHCQHGDAPLCNPD